MQNFSLLVSLPIFVLFNQTCFVGVKNKKTSAWRCNYRSAKRPASQGKGLPTVQGAIYYQLHESSLEAERWWRTDNLWNGCIFASNESSPQGFWEWQNRLHSRYIQRHVNQECRENHTWRSCGSPAVAHQCYSTCQTVENVLVRGKEHDKSDQVNFARIERGTVQGKAERKDLVCHCWKRVLEDENVAELTSNQEEADRRLLLHAAHASQEGHVAVAISSEDTDVFILLLNFSSIINAKLFMRCGSRTRRSCSENRARGMWGTD